MNTETDTLVYPWNILAVEVAVRLHDEINGGDDEVMSIYEYLPESKEIADWCARNYEREM